MGPRVAPSWIQRVPALAAVRSGSSRTGRAADRPGRVHFPGESATTASSAATCAVAR